MEVDVGKEPFFSECKSELVRDEDVVAAALADGKIETQRLR